MTSTEMGSRCAIVTGGAQGIGFAVAEALLSRGAQVMLWDIDPARGKAAADRLAGKGEVSSMAVDVRKTEDIIHAVSVTAGGKRPDILVNCAAMVIPDKPALETTDEEWNATLSVNLIGLFNCCKYVIPGMVAAGWGRVVNVSSLSGKDGNPGMAAYSASKAAVIGLTKAMGKEFAHTGVLINCVAPGIIDTPGVKQVSEGMSRAIAAKSPMGRMGRSEEVAELISWLCSERCSYSAGAVFDISGGRAVY